MAETPDEKTARRLMRLNQLRAIYDAQKSGKGFDQILNPPLGSPGLAAEFVDALDKAIASFDRTTGQTPPSIPW